MEEKRTSLQTQICAPHVRMQVDSTIYIREEPVNHDNPVDLFNDYMFRVCFRIEFTILVACHPRQHCVLNVLGLISVY